MDCLGSPTRKIFPGIGVALRQEHSSGSSAASSSRISACSGSVSWNSSTKKWVKRA
jgi:hypothetical protein